MKTMKIHLFNTLFCILAAFLTIAIFTSCGESKEEKAEKKNEAYYQNVQEARAALESHQYSTAVSLLQEGAQNGHQHSQALLGVSYMMLERREEGVRWIRKAAESGDATSMYNLALCFYYGIGVEKNNSEGGFWSRKAEELGAPYLSLYNVSGQKKSPTFLY